MYRLRLSVLIVLTALFAACGGSQSADEAASRQLAAIERLADANAVRCIDFLDAYDRMWQLSGGPQGDAELYREIYQALAEHFAESNLYDTVTITRDSIAIYRDSLSQTPRKSHSHSLLRAAMADSLAAFALRDPDDFPADSAAYRALRARWSAE